MANVVHGEPAYCPASHADPAKLLFLGVDSTDTHAAANTSHQAHHGAGLPESDGLGKEAKFGQPREDMRDGAVVADLDTERSDEKDEDEE